MDVQPEKDQKSTSSSSRTSSNEDKDTEYAAQPTTESQAGNSFYIDPQVERRIVKKIDLYILPILVLAYFLNSLDHSNMGNAKTAGLEATLGLVGNQYSLALSFFYITYVLTGPVFGIMGKIYGPRLVLAWRTLAFGIVTVLFVAVKNLGGLCALRILLGIFESAFLPIIIYYLTIFYRRGELAMRLAIVHCGQDLANAFGGLLGFALFRITGTSLASWRYLFLVEGCVTILLAPLLYWILPESTDRCTFLSKSEKAVACERIRVDSSSIVNEPFNLRDALAIFCHPTSWVYCIIELCVGIPLQSVQNFLSEIIKRFGYNDLKTNLWTVAPNLTGVVVLLLLSYGSDRSRLRWPFISCAFLFTFIGFIVYVALPNVITDSAAHSAAYFATFLMVFGASAPSVILDAWLNNNIADENKRVMLTSVGLPLSNLMGVVSSNIFLNQDEPKYVPALSLSAAAGGTGALLSAGLGLWMIRDNRRRNVQQGVSLRAQDVPSSELRDGPKSPMFRWLV